MAGRGTPYELLMARGATYKNKKRYMDRGIVDSPELGDPSEYLSPSEQTQWHKFKDEIPWLKECHRATVEVACKIRAHCQSGIATTAELKFMLQLMSSLGATPTSENRIPPGYFKEPGAIEDDDKFN